MFLNIMYYDLSNEAKVNNSTNVVSLSFGPLFISSQQVRQEIFHFFIFMYKNKIKISKLLVYLLIKKIVK